MFWGARRNRAAAAWHTRLSTSAGDRGSCGPAATRRSSPDRVSGAQARIEPDLVLLGSVKIPRPSNVAGSNPRAGNRCRP